MNSLFYSKLKSQRVFSWLTRFIASALVTAQLTTPLIGQLFAIENSPPKSTSTTQTARYPEFQPNRSAPTVSRPPATLQFSSPPTDNEIFRAHFFAEPLIPAGLTSPAENKELVEALLAFSHRQSNDDVSGISRFLEQHPDSPWRLSLLTDLGIFYRYTGHFFKALATWEEAWQLGKAETKPEMVTVANRAVAELADLNGRLGRYERLMPLMTEIQGRDFRGSTTEKIQGVRDGIWLMQNRPEDSFKCGPFALGRVRAILNPTNIPDSRITLARSTTNGTSLAQLTALADELNLNLQPAKRSPRAEVIVPAVVHWKAGHYAALVREVDGQFLIQDPTFGKDIWVSKETIDEEASGYCMVRSGSLPEGWQSVDETESSKVWGKGQTNKDDPDRDKRCDKKVPSCNQSKGMAQYAFHVMLVSLNIVDTPVGYTPSRGPAVNFTVTYNQREAKQPDTFTYSNLGNKWTFDWLAYIVDDPTNATEGAEYYLRGGGTDRYTNYVSGRYDYQQESRGELDRTSSTRYEQTFSDGSKEIYDLPDGSTFYPRKVFLTQMIDPAGNTLTFSYDSTFRLVAATDAIGQVTTVSYGSSDTNNALYYKITKVTDPFGRFASFFYNGSAQLTNITDVIGISSKFTYGSGDFINSMTTPYGTTTFSNYTSGTTRVLEATDPLGQTEHLEYYDHAPGIGSSDTFAPIGIDTDNLHFWWRNAFYWDKKAWHDAPGDYTKAHIYHFLHHDETTTSGILESEKSALESRIWLNYDGQAGPNAEGTNGQPTKIARVLDDGTTQVYRYTYNHLGHMTKSIDPVGRTNLFTYAANGIDLTEVRIANGANNDLIASFTYNSQHLPLTATDAAGQVTHFAYNSYGQIAGVTNALGQSTTLYYNNLGLVTNVIAALSGATNGFTYDATNRIRTVTDSDGYTVTYDYDVFDRITKITFPDNTFQQIVYDKLDPVLVKDRRGHWSRKTYDALRRLTAVEDALGRVTQYSWCNCGSLSSITDPLGRTTTLLRDIDGRVTARILPDGTQSTFTYGITASRLLSSTDAKNQTTLYDYYADDAIKSVAYSNAIVPTSTITYTYDTNFIRLVSVADGNGTTTYTYNSIGASPSLGAGKLLSMDGPLANDTITYYYDELSRVTNRAINGVAQTVAFDALGRLTVLTNALGRFTNVYDGVSARISTNYYPNGQRTEFTYFDNSGNKRLQTLWHRNPTGNTISKFDYGYDADAIINAWTQQLDAQNPIVWSAEYDSVDQLTAVTIRTNSLAGAVLRQFVYSYDKAGNRFNEEIDLSASGGTYAGFDQLVGTTLTGLIRLKGHLSETGTVQVATSPAIITGSTNFAGFASLTSGTDVVQVTATDLSSNSTTNKYQLVVTNGSGPRTLTYDANGNLATDATAFSTNSYEWDAGDKLTKITHALTNAPLATTEFTYDPWGRRVRITEKTNGVVQADHRFVWAAAELGEERDSTGATVTKRFFAGGEQISGTNYYYTRDHLSSVREMLDSSGNLKARYDYDPFGRRTKITGSLDADFGFTGRYYHAPSGLHLTFFRVYDSTTGRWLSRDPMGQPSDLNLYCYADNNPLNFIDPYGLAPCDWANWLDNKIDAAAQKLTNTSTFWNYQVFMNALALKGFADVLRFGSGVGDAIYNPCTKPIGKVFDVIQDILRGFVLAQLFDMLLKSALGKALEAAESAAEDSVSKVAGPNCFVADTLVQTDQGSKPIQDIRPGDAVMSWDENSETVTTNVVTRTFERIVDEVIELKIEDGMIVATTEHPFWVENRGWVPASSLMPGDELRTRDGGLRTLYSTDRTFRTESVYNFEVAGSHSYFVSEMSILVHNASQAPRQMILEENYVSDAKKQALDYFKEAAQNSEMGQHGEVYKKAGNWLIQHANDLERIVDGDPKIVQGLRREGQRLIDYGKGISHK